MSRISRDLRDTSTRFRRCAFGERVIASEGGSERLDDQVSIRCDPADGRRVTVDRLDDRDDAAHDALLHSVHLLLPIHGTDLRKEAEYAIERFGWKLRNRGWQQGVLRW